MPAFIAYLFGLFCLTAAQCDDLTVIEDVLERSTPATLVTGPEVTLENSKAVVELTTPRVSTTSMDTDTSATESATDRVSVTEAEEEESIAQSTTEILPIKSTATHESLASTATETQSTTLATNTSPEEEETSTKNVSDNEGNETPLIDKEPIIGLGKPDLSRIYRKLFPYRRT